MDPFRGVGRAEMEAKIANARLSKRDARIVRMRLLDRAYFVDIGAEVGCDRRTAARRYNNAVDEIISAK